MSLPLTPETLSAAYEYLRTTPPFNRWNMPESEDVRFRISKRQTEFGRYHREGTVHCISMSHKSVGHTCTLMFYMAHEMVHLHLEAMGIESGGGLSVHNAAFRAWAAQVCKVHGFDLKAFY